MDKKKVIQKLNTNNIIEQITEKWLKNNQFYLEKALQKSHHRSSDQA